MRILLAPDSFKEAASAEAIAQAMARGIKRGDPQAECRLLPLSDGGEGLTHALVHATGGTLHDVETVDAVGRPIIAQFGFLGNKHTSRTAVVELASASGLEQVSPADRDPMAASTFGTGLLIRAAIDAGADRIVLGLGGSATTDGGTGLAHALGFHFLDTAGHDIPLGGGSLVDLSRIDDSEVPYFVKNVPIVLACDVTNPLCGPNGCSAVYGPQKGASREDIVNMDRWMQAYAVLTARQFPHADPMVPGTGAAGGLGFAFLSYMNAVLEPGASIVLEETSLESFIQDSDIVITGEGRLDGQTAMGKAPIAVARLAKKYGKPVFAFSGCVTPDAIQCNDAGIDAFFPILRSICSLEEAMEPASARKNLSDTVEQVMRVVRRFS